MKVMKELRFVETEGEPSPEDFKVLASGMLAHHASQGHTRTWKKYSIFLKDKKNIPHAGIILSFTWNGMRIESLWVDEALRGKKYGTMLMEMAEKEALKRGCDIAYTDTFSWQAPEFYKKLGYKEFGKLKGYPTGESLTYFYKKLK